MQTSASADPGDLLQTFVNPNPTINRPSPESGKFAPVYWSRPAVAAIGKKLAVGFPFDDTFGTDAGIVYLFDRRIGEVLRVLKSPNPTRGGSFGCSLAAVGNRLLIGACRESSPGKPRRAGATYVFDTSTGELLHALKKPAPAERDCFGSSARAFGANFLVGCPCDDTGATDAGALFLYDSSTGELLSAFRSPDPKVNVHFGGWGGSIAAAGDDLLVGVDDIDPKGQDTGAAYLFEGSTGKLIQTFRNPETDRGRGFAFTVAALEGNLLISDKNHCPPRADGGVVYLFDSVTGDVLRTFNNPTPAVDDGFGTSIAVVEGNVLVGANHANADGFNVGAAHLFDGSTGEHLHTFSNPTPAWDDYFGVSIEGLGKDFLITAPCDDTAGPDAGALYLFQGGSSSEFAVGEPEVTISNRATTRLYVRTSPPGASVFLDKRPIGTSNGLFIVPPGKYQVTFELPGHAELSLPVKVAEGQITRIEEQLKRNPR
jgi:outer membrane protein assembly factor BamB